MTATLSSRRWHGIPEGDGPTWTPLVEAERRVMPVVSDLCGIVTSLYPQMRDVDDIPAYAVGARACESRHLVGHASAQVSGGGAVDERAATIAAIAETVERYSAVYWPAEQIVEASWNHLTEAGYRALAPESLRLFTDAQFTSPGFPFQPFTPDARIAWTQGLDLGSGEPTLLPASLVYMSQPHTDAVRIGHATSNGLGAGCTWDEAVVSGLLELIERDGFCIAWHNRLSLPLIDPASDEQIAAFFERYVRPTGLDVSLVDLSSFTGVPAVITVVRNRATAIGPFAIGGAAAGTPQRAIIKAVVEAFQTRVWMRAEQRDGDILSPDADFNSEVHRFDDHVRLYAGSGMVHATEFLDASPAQMDIGDLPSLPERRPRALIRAVLDRLAEQNIDVYVADATSPDVAEAGLVVARVLAPALVPLDASFRARFLGVPRLRQRPLELGLLDRVLTDDELNPYPHPYP
ncbi:hypothetical protein GCM10012275_61320 [Longimycelium tulufanense]|uniref:YcaO domain-containing protein n=1 Tax=Longimycelium tulufanense TaxID=907463 RepID=A0A8J3FXT4_9PSEU|nr:YcaO-like family protein [Longimycelium tulufanense]GGM82492.1 hypothetical protein GCM10012275_61320 [Longimycelium tulufanense]